ncbi:MAG: response regulator transcription factor [Chitinophaga sp.]|uniref:LytR/AlgR family response regulator transcription factor n=1 Tax=Chitinophaga sp. TaxID=1869181 RepID=UPI0025C19B56|nr:LytTR family DNA-binding domain-containing protein [Chitinophaga sp.]MBV8254435.1 response regulator transcription factor [Chitinophaga sp.]
MIKAIIIDDERNSRDIIALMLAKYCPFVTIADMASDCADGIEKIRLHQPQLVFLDLEMPDGIGFDILTGTQAAIPFEAIFVTAFEKKFLHIIRFSEIELILKPIDKESLLQAVNAVSARISAGSSTKRYEVLMQNFNYNQATDWQMIVLDQEQAEHIISISDINYFEAVDEFTVFYMGDGQSINAAAGFRYYLELFAGLRFYQLNNSQMVQLAAVSRISSDGSKVILRNGATLEITERRKKDLILRLQ